MRIEFAQRHQKRSDADEGADRLALSPDEEARQDHDPIETDGGGLHGAGLRRPIQRRAAKGDADDEGRDQGCDHDHKRRRRRLQVV